MIGFVGLVVAGAAFLLRRTRGVDLRQPTEDQAEGMAKPLARLALRHVPAHLLNADLLDILSFGAATGAYLNDGPLTEPLYEDPGIPDDLQENQR